MKKYFEVLKFWFGNPHFVCFNNELSIEELEKYGPILEKSKYFPDSANIEFVKILGKNRIKILVWERGVGRTLSCGTGACASSVASIIHKSTNSELIVDLEGGKLKTIYNNITNKIFLIGNSEFVYKGEMII